MVGLGPAGPDLVTTATLDALDVARPRFLRTARHPSASLVDGTSFDDLYEKADTLDEVYGWIVDAVVAAAEQTGDVLYAVPGSPAVAERTVELLRGDDRVDVTVVPALSFADLAWSRLGVDPLAAGASIVDGRRFSVAAAGNPGPLLVGQCDTRSVLSDIKLSLDEPFPSVTVLRRLGLPDEAIFDVAWEELDRAFEPDHLTSLYIPTLAAPVAYELMRFAELVRVLRERCPWDREQDHRSLEKHLIEESYEVIEAIESGDPAQLEEELGDLLFQVFFHATLAAEAGEYTIADVARGIHDKLVHRHPHVFGDVQADSADAVRANWEQIKKAEKGRDSVMDGIPGGLPALLYARKVQQKAKSVGFDWDSADDVYPKVEEELAEVRADPTEDEVGDLLFSVVNVARHLDIDPESALRAATAKFRDRFKGVEALAAERGVDLAKLDLAGLDALWDEIKSRARKQSLLGES